MRFIKIDQLEAGMTTARPIYNKQGALLIKKGHSLESRNISALHNMKYVGIYIVDALSHDVDIEAEEMVDPETRHNAVSLVESMYAQAADTKLSKASNSAGEVTALITDIVERIFESDTAVMNVPLLRTFDEYTYRHSVDVGMLTIMLGKAMNLSKENLMELGKSAFFHDLGKMFVPLEILNKEGRLTDREYEIMQKHTQLGYDFVRDILHENKSVTSGVLFHHEKYDGTGYPHKLKGEDIPIFGRMIAVADVYDALGTDRPYRRAFSPSESYEAILAQSGTHFDPDIVLAFRDTIAPYPAGITVKLSNGLHGLVVRNNPSFIARPLIKVFNPANPSKYKLADLANDMEALHITITGLA
ncbi:MAG: HD-GYP domain-containing protein [Defluviitaleaceae bacterium]|nr:HD-GYP domain-containing protein [Defluviitaleaceae bacterium]